jgi:hypothetical protein
LCCAKGNLHLPKCERRIAILSIWGGIPFETGQQVSHGLSRRAGFVVTNTMNGDYGDAFWFRWHRPLRRDFSIHGL